MNMKTKTRRLNFLCYLSVAMLLIGGAASVRAEEALEPRISTSSQGQGIQRDGVVDGTISRDEFEPLITIGSRSKSTRASDQKTLNGGAVLSAAEAATATANTDFWIYSADVELFSDLDRDGYFYGINLTFDADTVYTVADVYAVIYLSYNLGPWNEYASTDDFAIFGASGDDAYVIETELVSGYPTGEYDILIELFDVYDGTFVASLGPDDSSALSFLPIEDLGRDTPYETTVTVNNGGGGSLGWFAIFSLLGIVGLGHRKTAVRS
jgi:hypothetical protein